MWKKIVLFSHGDYSVLLAILIVGFACDFWGALDGVVKEAAGLRRGMGLVELSLSCTFSQKK